MTHSHHLVPRLGITLMIGASALTHTLAAPDRESFALEKRPIEGVPVTAFDIPEGFQIEVWAQSPMVFSPVAMDCDAAGRLWVTEGIDYNRGRVIEAAVDFTHIALVQLFMGIGVALFFMPTLSILMSDLPPHQIADGAGLATFLRTLGGSFAASLTTWIWIRRADQHHAYLSESISTYDPVTRETLNQLGGANGQSYAQLEHMLGSQAYMMSTVDYFTLMGWVFAGLVLLVWLAKPPFGAKAGPASAGH